MSSEQRFIVYSLVTSYHIKAEKRHNSGKGKYASSFIELSKTVHSRMADYLLSEALIEFQLHSDRADTLETMPPSHIIVVDEGMDVSSSKVQDRLLAWAGDYRMFRHGAVDRHELYIVFTDEEARNSALTEMQKFGGRKATKYDSVNASAVQKSKQKNQQKKKSKNKAKTQSSQRPHGGSGKSNSDWIDVGDSHTVTLSTMPKKKKERFDGIKFS